MLKALRESYDRFLVGGLIATFVVVVSFPSYTPARPGLGRFSVMAVVPLTAALA
jgi:hypothetical protein